MAAVLSWVRTDWVYAHLVMPPPATGVVGHSYGAMLGARFALGRPVSAFAGLSGGFAHEWNGDQPYPLSLLDLPTLLTWGGRDDPYAHLSDGTWQGMARPRHRVVFAEGAHWDYLGNVRVPCRPATGGCPHIAGATADLLTVFFGRYLPPEFATDLPYRIPPTLTPPALDLTFEQEFYAGGYLGGYEALAGDAECGVTVSYEVESLIGTPWPDTTGATSAYGHAPTADRCTPRGVQRFPC